VKRLGIRYMLLICIIVLSTFGGYATASEAVAPASTPAVAPLPSLPGYLGKDNVPNSLVLLPPPPAPGSAELARDEDVAQRTFATRDTPRFDLAHVDYDLDFPRVAGTYSCSLNAPITERDTPTLFRLLRRVKTDANLSTNDAKVFYNRQRPYVVNHEKTCAPEGDERLSKNGSYPSGHTTIAWTWALVLVEISPDRADALLLRARVFGENRNVCNQHWYSDVEWGRTMAAALVARLHTSAEFLADLEVAKKELESVRAKGLAPTRDCQAEAAAMAIQPY
jgi:acid phosphatase (class A)